MSKLAADIGDGAAKAVEFTGEVINDLVNVVLQAVGGVVQGATLLTNTAGDVTDKLVGGVIGVQATQIFKDVGSAAKDVSDGLGNVIGTIPLVGQPTAFVVQRAGEGVYHVIVSVGNAAGSSAKKVGLIAKKTTDLVVFTLSSGQEELEGVGKSVTQLVTMLTARPKGGRRSVRRQSHRRRRAQRGGSRTRSGSRSRSRSRRKRRGGLALTAPNLDQGAPFHPVWPTNTVPQETGL